MIICTDIGKSLKSVVLVFFRLCTLWFFFFHIDRKLFIHEYLTLCVEMDQIGMRHAIDIGLSDFHDNHHASLMLKRHSDESCFFFPSKTLRQNNNTAKEEDNHACRMTRRHCEKKKKNEPIN